MKPLRRLGMGPNVVVVAGDQNYLWEVLLVSIVRIGLAETKHFSQGYAAIFGLSSDPKNKNPINLGCFSMYYFPVAVATTG